jgi:Peptidogalycan biosysnthesis/recognition
MKKVFFASAAILLAFISTQAQTNDALVKNNNKSVKEERKEIKKEKQITLRQLEGNEINYQSKQEFYRTFGDLPNVEWTKGKYFDQAVFNKDGIITTAYFDFDAQLVGTTCTKTFDDLPAAAQKQISKQYKDYTVEKVIFFDDNEDNSTDMVLYANQFDDEDNYFVELKKDNKAIVVQVTMDGLVGYFTTL